VTAERDRPVLEARAGTADLSGRRLFDDHPIWHADLVVLAGGLLPPGQQVAGQRTLAGCNPAAMGARVALGRRRSGCGCGCVRRRYRGILIAGLTGCEPAGGGGHQAGQQHQVKGGDQVGG